MLEPVVVKPEIISNTASRYDGICPESVNGSAPARDSAIQLNETVIRPSLAYMTRRCDRVSQMAAAPTAAVPSSVQRKKKPVFSR